MSSRKPSEAAAKLMLDREELEREVRQLRDLVAAHPNLDYDLHHRTILTLDNERGRLDETIRDALDVAVGWVGVPSKDDADRVRRMRAILEAAL